MLGMNTGMELNFSGWQEINVGANDSSDKQGSRSKQSTFRMGRGSIDENLRGGVRLASLQSGGDSKGSGGGGDSGSGGGGEEEKTQDNTF